MGDPGTLLEVRFDASGWHETGTASIFSSPMMRSRRARIAHVAASRHRSLCHGAGMTQIEPIVETYPGDAPHPSGGIETIYSSPWTPNPSSALDVLAFILTPIAAFAQDGDGPESIEAIRAVLDSAKQEAVRRWMELNRQGYAATAC